MALLLWRWRSVPSSPPKDSGRKEGMTDRRSSPGAFCLPPSLLFSPPSSPPGLPLLQELEEEEEEEDHEAAGGVALLV